MNSFRRAFGVMSLAPFLAATCAKRELPAPPVTVVAASASYVHSIGQIHVAYRTLEVPGAVPSGGDATVRFEVRNTGKETWPAAGPLPLRFGYHWSDPLRRGDWNAVVWDDGRRAGLPGDVPPGATATLSLSVHGSVGRNPGYKLVIAPLLEGPGGGWTTEVPLVLDVDVK